MEMQRCASSRATHEFDGNEGSLLKFSAWLSGFLRRLRVAARRRHELDNLLTKTDRELRDIGLTRRDVLAAASYRQM